MADETVELACIPGAIPARERVGHFVRAAKLFGWHALERQDLSEGYAFRFAAEHFEAVTRFVANERLCCPFVDFEIVLTREPHELWLKMSGPPGTRAVLEAELKLVRPCGCWRRPG